jgi:hypothetical protein
VFALRGFKDTAASGDEMRRLIAAHSKMLAVAIEPNRPDKE